MILLFSNYDFQGDFRMKSNEIIKKLQIPKLRIRS